MPSFSDIMHPCAYFQHCQIPDETVKLFITTDILPIISLKNPMSVFCSDAKQGTRSQNDLSRLLRIRPASQITPAQLPAGPFDITPHLPAYGGGNPTFFQYLLKRLRLFSGSTGKVPFLMGLTGIRFT